MFNWFFNIFKKTAKKKDEGKEINVSELVTQQLTKILTDHRPIFMGITNSQFVSVIMGQLYANGFELNNSAKNQFTHKGKTSTEENPYALDAILVHFFLTSRSGREIIKEKLGTAYKEGAFTEKDAEKMRAGNVHDINTYSDTAQSVFKDIAETISRTSKTNAGLKNLLKSKQKAEKSEQEIDSLNRKTNPGNGEEGVEVGDLTTDTKQKNPLEYLIHSDKVSLQEEDRKALNDFLYRVKVAFKRGQISWDLYRSLLAWVASVASYMVRGDATGAGQELDKLPANVAEHLRSIDDTDELQKFINEKINARKVNVGKTEMTLTELEDVLDATQYTQKLFRDLVTKKEKLFITAGALENHFRHVNEVIKDMEKKGLSSEDIERYKQSVSYTALKRFIDQIAAIPGLSSLIHELDEKYGSDAYKEVEKGREEYYKQLTPEYFKANTVGDETAATNPSVSKANTEIQNILTSNVSGKSQLSSEEIKAKRAEIAKLDNARKAAQKELDQAQKNQFNHDLSDKEREAAKETYYKKFTEVKQYLKDISKLKDELGVLSSEQETQNGDDVDVKVKNDETYINYLKQANSLAKSRARTLSTKLKKSRAEATNDVMKDVLHMVTDSRTKAISALNEDTNLSIDSKIAYKKWIVNASRNSVNSAVFYLLKNKTGKIDTSINTELFNDQFSDILMSNVLEQKANAVDFLRKNSAISDVTYEDAVNKYIEFYKRRYGVDQNSGGQIAYVIDQDRREKIASGDKPVDVSEILYEIFIHPEYVNDYPSDPSERNALQTFLNMIVSSFFDSAQKEEVNGIRRDFYTLYGTPLDTKPVNSYQIKRDLNNDKLEYVLEQDTLDMISYLPEIINDEKTNYKGGMARVEILQKDVRTLDDKLVDIQNKIDELKDEQLHTNDKARKEEIKQQLKELTKQKKFINKAIKQKNNRIKSLKPKLEEISETIAHAEDTLNNTNFGNQTLAQRYVTNLEKNVTDAKLKYKLKKLISEHGFYYKSGELIPAVEYGGFWFEIAEDWDGDPHILSTPLEDAVIIYRKDVDIPSGYTGRLSIDTTAGKYKKKVGENTYVKDDISGYYYMVDPKTNELLPYTYTLDGLTGKKPNNEKQQAESDGSDSGKVTPIMKNPFKGVPYNAPKPTKQPAQTQEVETEEKKQVPANETNKETPNWNTEENNKEQPTEDIVNPTQDEENMAANAGFYFGIQKTAAFFKFAESQDNYTGDNSLAEKKEQKSIENGDNEGGFQYNSNEQSKSDAEQDSTSFSMEKLGKVLKQVKTKSPEKWQEVVDLVKQSSAKSGDDLASFLELWAQNDWNASAALRDYNSAAVDTRNNNYFYEMFRDNVWPAIQTMPAIVNIVNSLSENKVVNESDVATNEYRNV